MPLDDVTDRVGVLFGQIVIDTLDDLAWPEHGRRIAATGEWSSSRLGRRPRVLARRARVPRGPVVRPAAGGAGGRARRPVARRSADLQLVRLGGVTLLPGFYHGELQGKQAVAAAVSLRYKVVGQLRIVVRGGAGNVFDEASDINAADLRWGAAVGLFHPSPVGPVSLEFGFRKGSSVASLSIGWN